MSGESEVWVDYDYPPMPRNYEKCRKCGGDMVLQHHCKGATTAAVRAVLEQHPLEVGRDTYAGEIVCTGCHRVLGNPMKHLEDALAAALDTNYEPPASTESAEPRRDDPRESSIVWEGL